MQMTTKTTAAPACVQRAPRWRRVILSLLCMATPALVGGTAGAQMPAAKAAPVAAQQPPQLPAPLPQAQRAILGAVVEDAAPKKLLGVTRALHGVHYLSGNEWHLYQYAPHIANLGGAYVGVGSDQSYLMIGMAQPEVAFLTDYDELVVKIHKVYGIFFAAAETREAFLGLWSDFAKGKALLQDKLAADPDRKLLLRLYGMHRQRIAMRFDQLGRRFKKAKVPCFVSDDANYQWVRAFVNGGRVRALRADLLVSGKAFAGVAEAVRKLGMTVRLMYTSNADSYWKYTPAYVANIQAMPFDDRSQYIRTIAMWTINRDYIYTLQPSKNLAAWLGREGVQSYRDFIAVRAPKPKEYPFRIVAPDPAQPLKPRKAVRPKANGKPAAAPTPAQP